VALSVTGSTAWTSKPAPIALTAGETAATTITLRAR
jgi:hypothetical protein